jgi:hypothetical protein
MERFLQIVKVTALVGLVVVLGILLAPTLKGPFVIIHFTTALRGWVLAQLVFLGLAFAAHFLLMRLVALRCVSSVACHPPASSFCTSIAPLRC